MWIKPALPGVDSIGALGIGGLKGEKNDMEKLAGCGGIAVVLGGRGYLACRDGGGVGVSGACGGARG